MSLELGGQSKTIQYLNLSKSGLESENDRAKAETCSQTCKFTNQPFIKDQSEYLCAVTRFSVPLVEVPTIAPTTFTIYQYSDNDYNNFLTTNPDIDEKTAGDEHKEDFYDDFERRMGLGDGFYLDGATEPVEISACFSFHEFMKKIQIALQRTTACHYNTNLAQQFQPGFRAAGDTQTLIQGANPGGLVTMFQHRVIPYSERIKMSLTADMRFQIMVSDDIYDNHIYVKLSAGMFRMLQFQTTSDNNAPLATHRGYRFHGRFFESDTPALSAADRQATVGTIVSAIRSDFNQRGTEVGKTGIPVVNGVIDQQFVSSDINRWASRFVVHTAHMSCADATRIREIVFTSDMAVKSEGNVGSSYKRFLCDYQVFNNTKFSYVLTSKLNLDPYSTAFPNVGDQSTVTEELPSHRIYQSANASAGRWQELVVPAPLWEVEVRAQVR